jgi:hypothetical protein
MVLISLKVLRTSVSTVLELIAVGSLAAVPFLAAVTGLLPLGTAALVVVVARVTAAGAVAVAPARGGDAVFAAVVLAAPATVPAAPVAVAALPGTNAGEEGEPSTARTLLVISAATAPLLAAAFGLLAGTGDAAVSFC